MRTWMRQPAHRNSRCARGIAPSSTEGMDGNRPQADTGYGFIAPSSVATIPPETRVLQHPGLHLLPVWGELYRLRRCRARTRAAGTVGRPKPAGSASPQRPSPPAQAAEDSLMPSSRRTLSVHYVAVFTRKLTATDTRNETSRISTRWCQERSRRRTHACVPGWMPALALRFDKTGHT